MPGLALVLAAAALGAPIFSVLGGAALLLLFWTHDVTIIAIPIDQYRLVTNATLPTVPLFTLAGFLAISALLRAARTEVADAPSACARASA